jgi:DNA-binding beta-propeller fold protein YncE
MNHQVRFIVCSALFSWLFFAIGCSDTNVSAGAPKAPAAAPSLQYVGAWGMKGSDAGQLSNPTSIAIDPLGNVFIADAGSHFIHKFDPQGTPMLSFQDDWLRDPQSIAIDRGGAIYAADAARAGFAVFLPSGDRYQTVRLSSHPNDEDMLSVAVADDGQIFVLDSEANQVFSYTPRFRLAHTWRPLSVSQGSKDRPNAIATGSDGYVYVLAASTNRILKFNEDGRPAPEIAVKLPGAGRKLGYEFNVSNGSIFVMDGDGLTLHVLNSDGSSKLDVNLAPQLGQTNRFVPALAASSRHELFVLDSPDSRVFRYRINF